MTPPGPPVTVVRACLRAGRGGSPTAVVGEAGLSDAERRRVPVESGTSHVVFVEEAPDGPGGPAATLRFFTAEGELPACGHGTVAALAFLAARAGAPRLRAELRTAARTFTGSVVRQGPRFTAAFDPGPVELREPTADERESVAAALGLSPDAFAPAEAPTGSATGSPTVSSAGSPAGSPADSRPGAHVPRPRVASVGRPRLLVPVASRSALAALAPDLDALRAACDRLGLLGAYVHSPPDAEGRLAARMFAPSIGVPEDIANANSTACLAAHLAAGGATRLAVDMGDALGSPATVTATAVRAGSAGPGASVPRIHVGGTAEIPPR